MRRHSILVRLGLAVFGMVLLCLGSYVAFGWALWSGQPWLSRALGFDLSKRFNGAYARALGATLSKDRDSDGFSDGFEAYSGSDPRSSSSQPPLDFNYTPGFTRIHEDSSERLEYPTLWTEPGERRRVRIRACVHENAVNLTPNMRLLLTPSPPGLISLPGGMLADAALVVPVATDGTMEFDFSVPVKTVPSDGAARAWVSISNPWSQRLLDRVLFGVSWRQQAVPCFVESISRDDRFWHWVLLRWPPGITPQVWLIEATRDTSEEEWIPVGIFSSEQRTALVVYGLDDSNPRFRGPVRFRVQPLTASPVER